MEKKLFIAISYDNHKVLKTVQQLIVEQLQPLALQHNGTVRPSLHLHFTFYFLGNINELYIPSVIKDLQICIQAYKEQLGPHAFTHYTTKCSLDFIDNHEVIAQMLEPSHITTTLYALIATKLAAYNTHEKSQSFLPHITFARIRKMHRRDFVQFRNEAQNVLKNITNNFSKQIDLSTHQLILFSSNNGEHSIVAKFDI